VSSWLDARNILMVRLDNIGDVVMLGPALRAIKHASPEARITLLGSPAGIQAAPLLQWIDDTIEWRPVWQDVGGRMSFDPDRERELIGLLQSREFDAAMIFTSFSQTPHVPAYVCYLAGIPLRAGESKEFGGSVLTHELRSVPDDTHQVERNLGLVEALGFPVIDRRLEVDISNADRQVARDLFLMAGVTLNMPVALVHPGASAAARRYPASEYAEVARLFIESGWQVIVTGTSRESEIVNEAGRGVTGATVMMDSTTLGQYAAMVELSSVVVCGNTLPLHLADALGIPVVALYSGTDLESQWRPRFTLNRILRRETACYPCYRFECPIGQPCLDIRPDEVLSAAQSLLTHGVTGYVPRWEAAGG
jgi:ADP-heptose:LPS heptosyltransferase